MFDVNVSSKKFGRFSSSKAKIRNDNNDDDDNDECNNERK